LELPCAYGKTVLSLYLIAKLKRKTLIIVHKEFLMNQWIERIQQFLPGAKVGKIQGPHVDIDGKDIVLGMLQSLSMKDYDARLFSSFGLTVIDEVHHISSEVFSCALFKIVTACTLGLSATMNRKDGTTYIFKQFLGEIVYKGTRDEDHAVVVRAITYKTLDEEFNEIKRDYRGDVQHSSMISKLCTFVPRTEFILDVLRELWTERAGMQIMVLAHNRNVLTYLHDAIEKRGIAEGSVGYYVGGMKEKELKTTETKHIVIATYSMAQEALDIRTLTTLVMVTPKTDIEQAVGRILRVKHGSPLVIDIVDTHAPFQNQWRKRRQFYKKQNYKIVQCHYKKGVSGFFCLGFGSEGCDIERGGIEDGDVVLGGGCLLPLSSKNKSFKS
jgi:superfamily II DNA or RNA helicase